MNDQRYGLPPFTPEELSGLLDQIYTAVSMIIDDGIPIQQLELRTFLREQLRRLDMEE